MGYTHHDKVAAATQYASSAFNIKFGAIKLSDTSGAITQAPTGLAADDVLIPGYGAFKFSDGGIVSVGSVDNLSIAAANSVQCSFGAGLTNGVVLFGYIDVSAS